MPFRLEVAHVGEALVRFVVCTITVLEGMGNPPVTYETLPIGGVPKVPWITSEYFVAGLRPVALVNLNSAQPNVSLSCTSATPVLVSMMLAAPVRGQLGWSALVLTLRRVATMSPSHVG